MLPQAHKEPSDFTAKKMSSPSVASTQFVSGESRIGERKSASPTKGPLGAGADGLVAPQAHNEPAAFCAAPWAPPVHILTQLVAEPICTGSSDCSVEPFPNWP